MKKINNFSEESEETIMSSNIDHDEIDRLIKLLEDKNLSEFELEVEGFRIRIARNAQVFYAPQSHQTTGAGNSAAPAGEPAGGGAAESLIQAGQPQLHFVTSPMVGTFYRAPAPNAPPFIEIGEPAKKKQTLCIIEAMKLMNEIECDVDGIIKNIFVENGKPVEYGQKLFSILPTP
jgi:acetyl-CoA carboxylase biotin carboxyl carrier protein